VTQGPGDVPRIDDWSRLLADRVAVVTGGGDGIGGAISRLFAQHGALVEVAEIDQERADRVVADIRSTGGEARSTLIDVRNDTEVGAFATDVITRRRRVDVLVNNVGDFRPSVSFEDSTAESWKAMFDINLHHVISVTRAFIPTMCDQRGGSIVNVHSVEGMRGFPVEPVYGASKAAVAAFTRNLAVRYGRMGIRANGIGTDLTQTPQVDCLSGSEDHDHLWEGWAPVGRVGWPEEQARAALFLASDMSSFVTGHNIPVDGGTLAGGGWFYSPTARRFTNRSRGL
jgi:3-oxoacyl-[acyl-carrier protein] reductase